MEHILNDAQALIAIFDLVVIVVAAIVSYNIGHHNGILCAQRYWKDKLNKEITKLKQPPRPPPKTTKY